MFSARFISGSSDFMPFFHFQYFAGATFTRNFDSHSRRVHSRHVVCRLRARAAKKPFRASLRSFPRNKIIHTIFVKPLQVVINRAMFWNIK